MKLKIKGDEALEILNILQRDLSEEEFDELLVEAQETRKVENKKEEDLAKDKVGLSKRGLWMWIALRLAHQLEWDEDYYGNYCWPKEGDKEQKAHALRDILRKLDMEKPRRFNKKDYPVVYKRLAKSVNRILNELR